ncbi:hypothetical protein Glove_202g81 [Diversispora epigaea]|uniref:Uncharacterized protein n=1 Tax=Diversispora epigaea TaxID=1348612 RepID=A0A397IJH0_9GLOM|nr:hypothetical protein Glove_202g81 [Diversispora epigaea]
MVGIGLALREGFKLTHSLINSYSHFHTAPDSGYNICFCHCPKFFTKTDSSHLSPDLAMKD